LAQRPQSPQFISFKGIFVYPKVSEPDYGSKDYPKPDGEFSLKLRGKLDDAEVKTMIAKLQPTYEAALEQAEKEFKALKVETRKKLGKVTVNPLFSTIYDEDENETGEVDFKFAMKYSGKFKKGPKEGQIWKIVPDIFDARGTKLPYFDKQRNPIKNAPGIWGGTVGRVAFELGMNKEGQPGYFIPGTGAAGLSLKLRAVRIITLVSGGQRSASDYGFEDEEGDDLSSQFANNETADETVEQTEGNQGSAGGVGTSGDNNPDF
jgi:hypothetical protein